MIDQPTLDAVKEILTEKYGGPQFEPFPKLARLTRYCVITEKIDGTNAQVYIGDNGEFAVGSRTRWITPEQDNYGFAAWAYKNKAELMKLGPGRHFGEWWGVGIQRNYGISERRFSLFNTGRWGQPDVELPNCVRLVPVLYSGIFSDLAVEEAIALLQMNGSRAEPGFANPEGVVVYHSASKQLYKKTLVNDEQPKGVATVAAVAAALAVSV